MKIFKWSLVVLWMVLIFAFSHQDSTESSELSGGITADVIEVVEETFPSAEIEEARFEITLRNIAHFTLFFVLGGLFYFALKDEFHRGETVISVSIVCATLYAITDEIHQIFVPGRTFEITDILIDTTGAVLAVFISAFVHEMIKKHKKNKTIA